MDYLAGHHDLRTSILTGFIVEYIRIYIAAATRLLLFLVVIVLTFVSVHPATAQLVLASQKISDTVGDLSGNLDPNDLDVRDRFGRAVAGIGDLDGDGIEDLAVGAPRDDDGALDAGAVYILFLNADGTVKAKQKISDAEGGFSGNLSLGDFFGRMAVASPGDLDGDGARDLAVGAYLDDDGPCGSCGAVYILFLNRDGTVRASQRINSFEGGGPSLDDDDRFGISATGLGDLDGDGVGDLAVGAYRDDDGGPDRGAVYVLFLRPDGTVKSHQKISETAGGFSGGLALGDRFGISVAGLGELDGGGDLAVGADLDDDGAVDAGAVYVLFLNPDGTVESDHKISSTRGGFETTLDAGDQFGFGVAGLDDLDGDGAVDLVVGAPGDDDVGAEPGTIGGDGGAVYVLFLNRSSTFPVRSRSSRL